MSIQLCDTGRTLNERIAITGIGVISPFGSALEAFWKNVRCQTTVAQVSNACQADALQANACQADFAGKIDDFGPLSKDTKRIIRKSLKLMNRETQLGVAAAQHAITDSALLESSSSGGYEPDRIGVCFGAGNVEIRRGDFQAGVAACRDLMQQFDPALWGQLGIPHIDPLWILRVLPNMPACHTAIANDLRGPNNTITQARVATNMAMAEARNAIIDGDADAMIVGGTGTHLLETPASDAADSVPPAEAAAAFVIERMGSAIQRGATIYGEILATGSATAIESDHRAHPPVAIAAAIENALHQSELDVPSVASIQTNAYANRLRRAVDQIGDAAAGSSAMNIAASLLAFHHGVDDAALAVNVDAIDSGLASCLILANPKAPLTSRGAA